MARSRKRSPVDVVNAPTGKFISQRMNNLDTTNGKLVRLLPFGRLQMKPTQPAERIWTPPHNFREICACQRHARRERTLWRRALRGARRRATALFITVPLAFCAIGMEAMNVSFPALAQQAIEISAGRRSFRALTTPKVREAFLNPAIAPATLNYALNQQQQDFASRYGNI